MSSTAQPSSSSSSPPTQTHSILPALPPQPPPPSSRRLPPPCWSHEETLALIDSYREKWYSLRRGNLKASHWQEVADAVGRRCPLAVPPKTSVQCRHKMEKLRKRYRTELQRALANPNQHHRHLFPSSWVYFKKMDSMEKGPINSNEDNNNDDYDGGDGNEDEEADDDDDDDNDIKDGIINTSSLYGMLGSGLRIRIPSRKSSTPPDPGFRPKMYSKIDQIPKPSPYPNSNFSSRALKDFSASKKRSSDGGADGGGRRGDVDPMAEMVAAIKTLGDGFVKMEQMKMEMVKEIETMRMEMEMKRTEMILQSQQRIMDAFVRGFNEKKKGKRMHSPES